MPEQDSLSLPGASPLKPGRLPEREFYPPEAEILQMPSAALEPGASVSAVVRKGGGGPDGFPPKVDWEGIERLKKTGYMPRVLHGHCERDDKGREIHAYAIVLLTRP